MPIQITSELVVDILRGILTGAFYGAQAALFGYLKSEDLGNSWGVLFKKDFWLKFKPGKAAKTVLVGAILGGFTSGKVFLPADITGSLDFLVFANFFNDVVVIGVDQLIKLIVRRTPIVRLWNAFKEKVLGWPLQA